MQGGALLLFFLRVMAGGPLPAPPVSRSEGRCFLCDGGLGPPAAAGAGRRPASFLPWGCWHAAPVDTHGAADWVQAA